MMTRWRLHLMVPMFPTLRIATSFIDRLIYVLNGNAYRQVKLGTFKGNVHCKAAPSDRTE